MPSHQDSAVKPLLIFAGILALLATTAFMALKAMGGNVDYKSLDGEQLFGRLCAQCHGPRGTDPRGVASSYVGKRDYWTKESLLTYIANPRRAKAKIPHMKGSKKYMQPIAKSVPMEARERLVDHVLKLMNDLK